MEFLIGLVTYVLPFLVVLTVLVFVHEMGHYLVARWNGVRVEVFSIGFGPELYGWDGKSGTRWKIASIPLGGYVKFFGDSNAASAADKDVVSTLSSDEQAVSFHHKRLGQRAAIVAAGPIANFIYAIVVLAGLFILYGQRITPPEIGRVLPDGAGAAAGLVAGDVVLEIDGDTVTRFEDVNEAVFMNPDRTIPIVVRRGDDTLTLSVTPTEVETDPANGPVSLFGVIDVFPANKAIIGAVRPDSPAQAAGFLAGDHIVRIDNAPVDNFERLQDMVAASAGRELQVDVERNGETVRLQVAAERHTTETAAGVAVDRWLLGIERAPRPLYRHGALSALGEAVKVSVNMVDRTFEYVGQMIMGTRGTEELGGPLRIAHVSGQAAQGGLEQLVLLSVLLSLNLGIINLFPVPVLDGGHLLFYACEAIRGKPLTERMQEYAFRVGLMMILGLTVFVTWNDLVNLRVVEYIAGLLS